MASVTTDNTSLRMLAERLNHPIRLTRWSAAREIAALLATQRYGFSMKSVLLDWLRSRTLESEIATGLSVLLCHASTEAVQLDEVAAVNARPSPLAEMQLAFVFNLQPTGQAWLRCHSGPAPHSFEPEEYFLKNKGAQVPQVLESSLRRLENGLKMPFFKQWAFEWHSVMEKTKSDHSGFPYYFVDASLSRNGVRAQLSQRQCDVYRSAYLRTLSCAAGAWGAPVGLMLQASLETLPANRGLLDVLPTTRPTWLDRKFECAELTSELGSVGRKLVNAHKGENDRRLASLRVPLAGDAIDFGHLTMRSVLVTSDFVPNDTSLKGADRTLPWVLPDRVSLRGRLENVAAADYATKGEVGSLIPLTLDVFALPFGFWHGDYFQAGISVPAPYGCRGYIDLTCEYNRIAVSSQRRLVGDWRYWHDQWIPEYHAEGMTRVGCITEIDPDDVEWARRKFDARIGWVIDARYWTRQSDYGEFAKSEQRAFYFE